MAIPIFQPQDNPTRTNFNARIEAANEDMEAILKYIGTPVSVEEIDELMGMSGSERFSCTMTFSGMTRTGSSWSKESTLNFAMDGDDYTANGSFYMEPNIASVETLIVSGVPADIAADMMSIVLTSGSSQIVLGKSGSVFVSQGNASAIFYGSGSTVDFSARLTSEGGADPGPSPGPVMAYVAEGGIDA